MIFLELEELLHIAQRTLGTEPVAPIGERGAGYSQSGTIVIVDKGIGVPTPKPILDCTKYGTKEQGGGSAAPRQPPPVQPRGSAGTIDKGETKRGFVIFEVPKSVKADTLRFHIDPPLGANDSVELRLG